MSTAPSRWLVTGGCGFVGVNLLPRLAERGIAVRVLDDLSMGRAEDIAPFGAELMVGDIRDPATVDRALAGVDVVVHLAAHTRVVESIEDPSGNFDVNVRGTFTLLEGVRRRGGVGRFVLASTGGAILGDVPPPVHEGMPARPLAPYGAGKLACEGYCSAYYGSFGIPTVALRFSNVYGPWSYQKGSVVAVFFKRILAGQPLVIYGDGRATRDFLYVGDLCRAVLAAVERECAGDVFHIAAGHETEVGALARMMLEVSGADVAVRHEPARRGEVERNSARIDHARERLGWTPAMPLAQGLRETWAWFREHSARL